MLEAVFFLDISNKKMYNMNRVGENVTSIEEYDVASINATTYAASGLTLVVTQGTVLCVIIQEITIAPSGRFIRAAPFSFSPAPSANGYDPLTEFVKHGILMV